MASKKTSTPIPLQSLDEIFGTAEKSEITEIALENLHSFENHPFKVLDDKKMEDLVESVNEFGVLVPGIVRMRANGGYEIIAGHRRKRACELAGLNSMPVIIKDMTDDEAIVIVVDSNIQREELLVSEKAFAYKMKYDALKRQGRRFDLTSCQVGKRLAADVISDNSEDSSRQILRYIHLTKLVDSLMMMTDIKKIPFNTAVELSYLKEEEQMIFHEYMETHDLVPSMNQAREMKNCSKEVGLSYSDIDRICSQTQTKNIKVQLPTKKLKEYFPEDYTKEQMETVIYELLTEWKAREC